MSVIRVGHPDYNEVRVAPQLHMVVKHQVVWQQEIIDRWLLGEVDVSWSELQLTHLPLLNTRLHVCDIFRSKSTILSVGKWKQALVFRISSKVLNYWAPLVGRHFYGLDSSLCICVPVSLHWIFRIDHLCLRFNSIMHIRTSYRCIIQKW